MPHLAEQDPCPICADPRRDPARLLVVEQPRDVAAFEEAGWTGRYHVLLGHINALEGIEAGHLTIDGPARAPAAASGVGRWSSPRIPTTKGDATAHCTCGAGWPISRWP
jgi:recombination protein RecR